MWTKQHLIVPIDFQCMNKKQWDISQEIFCVPQKEDRHTGLEQYGVSKWSFSFFGWTIPLPDDSLHCGCVTCLSHDCVKNKSQVIVEKEETVYRINDGTFKFNLRLVVKQVNFLVELTLTCKAWWENHHRLSTIIF